LGKRCIDFANQHLFSPLGISASTLIEKRVLAVAKVGWGGDLVTKEAQGETGEKKSGGKGMPPHGGGRGNQWPK
jgi:hypothetical protein